jgi:hypothetical protein
VRGMNESAITLVSFRQRQIVSVDVGNSALRPLASPP